MRRDFRIGRSKWRSNANAALRHVDILGLNLFTRHGVASAAEEVLLKQAKVIKRYANRKLYDTERSCYVTLDEISTMIKEGEEVRVIDNKSKDDLTAVTLAQIIVEEEKKVAKMPLKLLRSIIQSSNDAIGDLYKRAVADPVQGVRDDVERRVTSLFKKDGASDAPAGAQDSAAEPAAANATAEGDDDVIKDKAQDGDTAENGDGQDESNRPVRAFVNSAAHSFETWQKRIDESVKEGLNRMTHLSHVGTDVEALRERIQELEARLEHLE